MAKTKFGLKKNIGKELPAILGRTGANLAGYTLGSAVNKQMPNAKPLMKGIGLLGAGMALQLVDNGYAEAGGFGLSSVGFSLLMGDVAAKSRAKTKEGDKNPLLDILSKAGLAGPDDMQDGSPVDWEEAYRQAAEEQDDAAGYPETDGADGGDYYREEDGYEEPDAAGQDGWEDTPLNGVETDALFT